MKRREFISKSSLFALGLLGISKLQGKEKLDNQDSWEEGKCQDEKILVKDIKFVYRPVSSEPYEFDGKKVHARKFYSIDFKHKGELPLGFPSSDLEHRRWTDDIYLTLCDGKKVYDGKVLLYLTDVKNGIYEYRAFIYENHYGHLYDVQIG